MMRALLAALAILLGAVAAPVGADTLFPGEDALALATQRQAGATREDVTRALERIFDRLEIPPERRARYAFAASANLVKERKYYEADELSESVLLAGGSVKLGFAHNAVIISGGDVVIAHGAGLIVIARGSIHLSFENALLDKVDARGIYISAGAIDIGSAVGPTVYAVKGAKVDHSGPITAYNSDLRVGDGLLATKHATAALFLGEPIRAPEPSHMLVNAGETMRHGGQRCRTAVWDEVDLLTRMLPAVRREANCPSIDSASVTCTQEADAKNAFTSREHWAFGLCGRTVGASVSSSGLRPSKGKGAGALQHTMTIDKPAGTPGFYGASPPRPPAAPRAKPLSDEQRQRFARLFREGAAHLLRGELVEARDSYRAASEISGAPPGADANLANVERQIARADEQVRGYSAAIDSGRATARLYADRGLARISWNDVSRGLRDLDRALEMDNTEPDIALDRAWGYILANRPAEGAAFAGALIARDPRMAKAYDVRAWAKFVQNVPKDAYLDAFSSLVEAPKWSTQSFAGQKAGYRVLVGYLALRQTAPRAQATEWLRQWRPFMSPGAWPDALALYLAGELDERDAMNAAAARAASDRGAALGEAYVFLALDELFGGGGQDRQQAMTEYFRSSYAAGRTLSQLLYSRMHTPGQKLTPQRVALPRQPNMPH
jgi:hypothetical protein